ncbi:MAG: hypothetical protein Q4C46_05455 [Bacillota bacterium]|nr:hypothetical protein [Bacillota bacterium]
MASTGYVNAGTKPKFTEEYKQAAYNSNYQSQIDSALDKVTNREEFTYDPLKDANYQAMAKLYQKQGEQAAQNTLGDAAALNGGFGSSFAVTASQQARNDYNQQLASQIPSLQEAAYNRYLNNFNMNLSALDALRSADDTAYGRYRDTVGDNQWQYEMDYGKYRDDVGDYQWGTGYNRSVYESDRDYKYQQSRDKVADKQWAKEFALQKKSAAARSRGGSNGNNGYIGPSSSSSSSTSSNYSKAKNNAGEKKYNNGLTQSQWEAYLRKNQK